MSFVLVVRVLVALALVLGLVEFCFRMEPRAPHVTRVTVWGELLAVILLVAFSGGVVFVLVNAIGFIATGKAVV